MNRYHTLRANAVSNTVGKTLRLSPLLNCFLSSRAQLYGLSENEVLRRLLVNSMDEAMKLGSFAIPNVFLASVEGKLSGGTPYYLRGTKGNQPTVPYVAEP